ncbi:copper homeostasis protein CutC [Tamlana sp. 2201CG12-4]|uniref:copper homeostasis protein CutC n=1 Tax=Tamlana sp. 2201CG12-4 TaxID=3112582 RepID=UPI002DBA246B|nr:copper homeostasis protein CutC [Tamlana sp. 2201CG12-4]MEC3905835.1 copper homeostasis protein CutC [Tamlana sp. 2201CG12-4]
MLLEVCANSYQSAINAQEAGAHRIELCSELAVGGITPSYGLIKQVVKALSIPVYVLIRPKSGRFTYTKEDIAIIKQDIEMCKRLGCKGIVSGILNADNSVDVEQTKILVELSKPLDFTFHRAFDWVPNPKEALQQLIEIGVNRVLTSGQQTSAEKGMALLSELHALSKGAIEILPGGGINSGNAALFKQAGFTEIHVSATTIEVMDEQPKVPMNSIRFFDDAVTCYSDKRIIKDILKAVE